MFEDDFLVITIKISGSVFTGSFVTGKRLSSDLKTTAMSETAIQTLN